MASCIPSCFHIGYIGATLAAVVIERDLTERSTCENELFFFLHPHAGYDNIMPPVCDQVCKENHVLEDHNII